MRVVHCFHHTSCDIVFHSDEVVPLVIPSNSLLRPVMQCILSTKSMAQDVRSDGVGSHHFIGRLLLTVSVDPNYCGVSVDGGEDAVGLGTLSCRPRSTFAGRW